MTKSASVSVAMATYNGGKYLDQQLQSLTNQSWLPDELIITDDGSSDDTINLAENFSRAAPFRVSVFNNERRLGYARNFERAASLCSGDIVFFCDQDDWWQQDKIETSVLYFQSHPEKMVVINDAMLTDRNLNPSGRTQFQIFRENRQKDQDNITGCFSAHRKIWQDIALPFPEELAQLPENFRGHDVWINGLAQICGAAGIVDAVLQYYRRHDSNHSTWMLSDPSVSHFKVLAEAGLSTDVQPWLDRAELFDVYQTRLLERLAQAPPSLVPFIKIGIEHSMQVARRLRQRAGICSMGRIRRLPEIVRFAADGGYHQIARGYLSACKDLVRRT